MNVFISDIIAKKDKYGPDYYWIVGQLPSGKKAIIEDISFDLRRYIGQHVEMLLSFMRSPYSELKMGIHNKLFISEKYYSIELIDELLNSEGAISGGDEGVIILTGKHIDSYTIPEKWNPLIQRTSFKALFNKPSALKTEDGIYLLYPFHSRKQVPLEEMSQEVIMGGTLRLEAWLPIHEGSLVDSFKVNIEKRCPENKIEYINIKGFKNIIRRS